MIAINAAVATTRSLRTRIPLPANMDGAPYVVIGTSAQTVTAKFEVRDLDRPS